MKKIVDLDETMLPMGIGSDTDKTTKMPTRREMLKLFGNYKADSADDARRTRRIISKLCETSTSLVLENEDMAYLVKIYERNATNLPAWMQGQILDYLDSAETVTPEKKV